jgi:hypothetical protein
MRQIMLPVGQVTVAQADDGDIMLVVVMAGDLTVSLKLTPHAASQLADALEDETTEAIENPKTWGVYRRKNSGDGADEPVLLGEFDTYQAAEKDAETRKRLDDGAQRFTFQYFWKELEAVPE